MKFRKFLVKFFINKILVHHQNQKVYLSLVPGVVPLTFPCVFTFVTNNIILLIWSNIQKLCAINYFNLTFFVLFQASFGD